MTASVARARRAVNNTTAASPAIAIFRVTLGRKRAIIQPMIRAEMVEALFNRPEIINNHGVSKSAANSVHQRSKAQMIPRIGQTDLDFLS
jgi:hypothetical protein